jgi:cytoskeletal protein RodZ
LRAIEEDDVKNLPGTFFYKNFVKQYAAIVGVKEAEIRAGIEELTAAAEEPVLPGTMAQPPLRPMDPIVADANRYFARTKLGLSVSGLVVALMACSGFYAWWIRPKEVAAAKPQPPPAAVNQGVHQNVHQGVPQGVQPTGQPTSQIVAPPVAQPAPAAIAVSAQNPPPAQAGTVQVTAEAQTQTTIDGINRVVLNLAATEKTWLSITSEGKRIFSGFLEPSQTKILTGIDAARMTVGNAGGINVLLNGKPIGPIGKSGQVRVVLFTPDNFEVLPLDLPVSTPSETL